MLSCCGGGSLRLHIFKMTLISRQTNAIDSWTLILHGTSYCCNDKTWIPVSISLGVWLFEYSLLSFMICFMTTRRDQIQGLMMVHIGQGTGPRFKAQDKATTSSCITPLRSSEDILMIKKYQIYPHLYAVLLSESWVLVTDWHRIDDHSTSKLLEHLTLLSSVDPCSWNQVSRFRSGILNIPIC